MSSTDVVPAKREEYAYGEGMLHGDIQYHWQNFSGKYVNGNPFTSERFVTHNMIPSITNNYSAPVSYSNVKVSTPGIGGVEHYFTDFSSNPDLYGASITLHKTIYFPIIDFSFERGLLKEKKVYKEGFTLPVFTEKYDYQRNAGWLPLLTLLKTNAF